MSYNSDVCLKGLGTGVCPWVYEDRLYADQDFNQGSPNTKQEYYPFDRNLLFRGIVRRFRNKKNCMSAVTLYSDTSANEWPC